MLRISTTCDVKRGGGGQICSTRRYFHIDTVIQGDFKWHITYIATYRHALYCMYCIPHMEPYLPSNDIILPETVFTDKVINQHFGRVCYLNCIKTRDKFAAIFMLQICEPGMIFGLRRDGRIHWSMSFWRRFLHPDTVWTHAAWSLRKSQLHSSSFHSPFHFCPPSFLFYTVHYRMLALQGGWCSLELHNSHVSHSSHVSPISYTPQEGWTDREKEGES